MDACQEVCSTNSHFFKAQQEIAATKYALLSREEEHSTQFAAMEKVTEETLERVTIGHKILTAKLISKSDTKLVSIEREHKRKLNTITKLEQENNMATDDLHALNVKEKELK